MSNFKPDGLFLVRQFKDMGFSFKQIADMAGVCPRTIFSWYHGEHIPFDTVNEVIYVRLSKKIKTINEEEKKGYLVYKKRKPRNNKKKKQRRKKCQPSIQSMIKSI